MRVDFKKSRVGGLTWPDAFKEANFLQFWQGSEHCMRHFKLSEIRPFFKPALVLFGVMGMLEPTELLKGKDRGHLNYHI